MRHPGAWPTAATLALTLTLAAAGCGGESSQQGSDGPKITPEAMKNRPPSTSVMPGMENLEAQKAKGVKGSMAK